MALKILDIRYSVYISDYGMKAPLSVKEGQTVSHSHSTLMISESGKRHSLKTS